MTAGGEQRGFIVTGRVQGVGFRWWATRLGAELGLDGSVKNRPDGSVEVHARGPVEGLDKLRRELEVGPGMARVDAVRDVESTEPIDRRGFQILGW